MKVTWKVMETDYIFNLHSTINYNQSLQCNEMLKNLCDWKWTSASILQSLIKSYFLKKIGLPISY